MPTEVVSRIQIQATQTGAAETTAGLKGLASAQDAVVTSSTKTEKSSLSVAAAYERQQRSLDVTYRSTQQFEKAQRTLDQALQQGLVTGARHSELSALNTARFGQQSNATKALSVVTQDLNGRIQASAGSFGVAGQALAALGPIGLGVAAVFGVAVGTVYAMSTASHELANKAKEIREFSEATGLTATQFQALRSEAGKFGIDSETLSSGLSKFTAGFNELRLGNGQLLTDIRKINPALADQMQATTDAATAFTLFGKAVAQTDNIFQRNALLKAGLGKGSAIFGGLFESAPDVAALATAFAAAGKGLDDNLIKKLAILDVEIAKTKSQASTVFASIFAESVLSGERDFANVMLDIAKALKALSEFKFPTLNIPDVPEWVKTALALAARATPLGAVVDTVSAVRSAVSSGASSYDSSFHGTSPANSYSTFQGAGAGAVSPEAVKTVEALVAGYKNYIAILGSAATPTERLAAAIAELEIKAKEAGNDGLAGLARGIAGLKLDDAIARQSAHNAALGQSASVLDLVKAKTLELEKARQQDAGLTEQQIANARTLTAEQALGVTAMKQQADASRIQTATLGMSAGAAAEYTAVQTRLADALRNKQALTAEDIAQIKAQAAALGQVTQASAVAAANDNVRFGARTSLLSREDVQIAQQLKSIYPDVATALNSVQASGLRTNQALSGLSSQISGQLVTGLSDIFDGTKSVSQGFGDMSKVIARAIEEMIVKLYIVIPLMRALQSLVSGFGGGGGSSEANAVASGIAPLARGQAFGSNVIPFAQGSVFANRVFDSPTLFKFASGGGVGSGMMGEAGPEAVVPLRRGADGKLGIQSAGGGANVAVNVNVQHDASQSKVSVQQSKNNSGGVDLQIMVEQIEGQIAGNVSDGRGSLHSAMTSKFGLTPKFA